jgi:hypothetical protein
MKMKIIIENTNGTKYFEKEKESLSWKYVFTGNNPYHKDKTITEEVCNALDVIFDLANPEQEDQIYYDFDRNREDNQEEEIIILDWLGW